MKKTIINERLIWIDALKGIACIIVANGHIYGNVSGGASGKFCFCVETVLAPVINGGLMVCIFAVLSGLLVTKSIGKKVSLVKGFVRRYIQLTVPITITGMLACIISNLGISSMEPISMKTAIWQGVVGVLFLGQSTINPAFWMMRSLFLGSLLCIVLNAIMYRIQNRRNRILIVVIFIGTSIIIRDHIIMSCLLGYLIGVIKKDGWLAGRINEKLLLGLLIASFLLMGWGHHWCYLFITRHIFPLPKSFDAVAKWLALYSAVFVFALDNLPRIQEMVSRKVLVFLGQCSMGVYCFHNLIIGTIGIGMVNFCRTNLELNGTVVCILAWCAVIICSVFVAYIYELIIGKKLSGFLRRIK